MQAKTREARPLVGELFHSVASTAWRELQLQSIVFAARIVIVFGEGQGYAARHQDRACRNRRNARGRIGPHLGPCAAIPAHTLWSGSRLSMPFAWQLFRCPVSL